MMSKQDAGMLKAWFSANFMGLGKTIYVEGTGCDTCGYGASSYQYMDLEQIHEAIDSYVSDLHSPVFSIDQTLTFDDCKTFIGRKVQKRSGKPFKSGEKIGTVKGVIKHPGLGHPSFTFEEDESYVECWRCEVFKRDEINE